VKKSKSIIALNRKAKFNYQIIDQIEVGIVLTGAEVKSIRKGRVSLDNSYAVDKKGEFWINNLYVDLKNYENSPETANNIRSRKLLLNKTEIYKINMKVKQNGLTMIPLDLHFNNKGFIKILLGISKGRKKGDLREYKKQQDWKREKARLEKK
jgi:SsrA-binding protein